MLRPFYLVFHPISLVKKYELVFTELIHRGKIFVIQKLGLRSHRALLLLSHEILDFLRVELLGKT